MADNIDVLDAGGLAKTMRTSDSGGVHTSHSKVDTLPADPLGANADAAIVTNTTGSISGKLRGLVKWAFERMPAALGQAVAAASLPVVVASDQSAIPVSDGSGSLTVDGSVTAAAGENHIGEVGNKLAIASATPTITAGAYASGYAVGTTLSFASAARVSGGSGVIESVAISDKAKQSANIDLFLFTATLSVPPTDNTAAAVPNADLANLVGVIPITSHHTLNANGVSCARSVGLAFKLSSGTTLYGLLVSRGTPTYASVSDLSVFIAIRQN